MDEKILRAIAGRLSKDPRLILEDVEGDIRVFVNMNVQSLRIKEEAFELGVTRWEDPGDYPSAAGSRALPSYDYVEDIYGGAQLSFDIPTEKIPPDIHWRIDHYEGTVRQYKMEGQHVQRITTSTSKRQLGILVFSDNFGREASADVALVSDALDEELYSTKKELDIHTEQYNQTYSLKVQWVHWEQTENKLTCTVGVTAELD